MGDFLQDWGCSASSVRERCWRASIPSGVGALRLTDKHHLGVFLLRELRNAGRAGRAGRVGRVRSCQLSSERSLSRCPVVANPWLLPNLWRISSLESST